jgi:hypothetical protein
MLDYEVVSVQSTSLSYEESNMKIPTTSQNHSQYSVQTLEHEFLIDLGL